jgi:hypothetical protein
LLLNDFVLGLKSASASASASEEEKADAFVRGLITSHHGKRRKGRRTADEEEERSRSWSRSREDGRSLSE